MTVAVYNEHFPGVLRLHPDDPASAFSVQLLPGSKHQIGEILKRIPTLHLQQRFVLTAEHYATVALYFMENYLFYCR